MKKIAFLFLTKDTLNRIQLWNKYFKGHEEQYSIYVHPYSYYKSNKSPSNIKDRLVRDNIIDTILVDGNHSKKYCQERTLPQYLESCVAQVDCQTIQQNLVALLQQFGF